MYLPNAEKARVDDSKLFDYLLDLAHPEGGAKARFYASVGFTAANANELRNQFLRIAKEHPAIEVLRDDFGVKYLIEGTLFDSNGRGIPLLTRNRLSIMIPEHSLVVLTHNIPEKSLLAGDVGTVVHVYPGDVAYEVEFATGLGRTIGVLTLNPLDIRLIASEILHVRTVNASV